VGCAYQRKNNAHNLNQTNKQETEHMNTPYFIIDMNLPGFEVPTTLAHRQPSQANL
jgi:hypothetical protein